MYQTAQKDCLHREISLVYIRRCVCVCVYTKLAAAKVENLLKKNLKTHTGFTVIQQNLPTSLLQAENW